MRYLFSLFTGYIFSKIARVCSAFVSVHRHTRETRKLNQKSLLFYGGCEIVCIFEITMPKRRTLLSSRKGNYRGQSLTQRMKQAARGVKISKRGVSGTSPGKYTRRFVYKSTSVCFPIRDGKLRVDN